MEKESSGTPHSISVCREVAQRFLEIHETNKKFNLINEDQWNFLCGWALEAVLPENAPPIPSYHTIDAFRQCGNDFVKSCSLDVPAFAYPASSASTASSGVATVIQILQVLKSTSAAGAWGSFISEAMKFYAVVFSVALRGFSQKYGGMPVPLETAEEFSGIHFSAADDAVHIALRPGPEDDLNMVMDVACEDGFILNLPSIQVVNEFLSILDRAYFYQEGNLKGRYIHARWGKGKASFRIGEVERNTTWTSFKVTKDAIRHLLNQANAEKILRAGCLRYGWI